MRSACDALVKAEPVTAKGEPAAMKGPPEAGSPKARSPAASAASEAGPKAPSPGADCAVHMASPPDGNGCRTLSSRVPRVHARALCRQAGGRPSEVLSLDYQFDQRSSMQQTKIFFRSRR